MGQARHRMIDTGGPGPVDRRPVCPYVGGVTLHAEAPYVHATLLTGNGGVTWHVMRDTRTRCGLNPARWSSVLAWRPAEHGGESAPAVPRICGRCRVQP